ncbi:MAG: 30S ribosomal protein S3 [Candidatus Aminicenantes bacterium]|nr:30S ribosomal protein S3 [Candidatus Aminicenantes bacterium]NIM81531.1 30S ribosomal protein S3 [Candidatus Aminicenantes bacterium]NIN20902.1 30S ribosomal protein S3 [Candidatus Aminicenantes bacterium]NIN44723.1 30S ribosomal protein S3 [Candidatus Aminicenantes bacterium]NIN87531.1 30S ribosomal protein S3 [Candidatus Aminicenantes bacterium]
MGQKTHPYGFRLGYNKGWLSLWYAKGRNYIDLFHTDIQIRKLIKAKYKHAGIASIEVKRISDTIRVQINTARPGIIIGKGGSGVQQIKKLLKDFTGTTADKVLVDVIEIKYPEIVAQLIGEGIAYQIERRISFRRAMRKAVDSSIRAGAQGIKIRVSGRLGGTEIARAEWYLVGKLPLQTLKADIDYGFTEAFTDYGQIGIKVWVYVSDRKKEKFKKQEPEVVSTHTHGHEHEGE